MLQSDAPLLQAAPADIHSGFFKWEVRARGVVKRGAAQIESSRRLHAGLVLNVTVEMDGSCMLAIT
jgi:hypothetical protein